MSTEPPSGTVEGSAPTADGYLRQGLDRRSRHFNGEAMEMFRQALLIDPDHRDTLLAMGALLGDLGRWQDARRVYEHAHRRYPTDLRISELLEHARNGRRRAPFVEPGRSARFDHRGLRRRGTIVGLLAFGFVVYVYIAVGLMTHFTVGLTAAATAAVLLAGAGSLLFRRHRPLALRAIVRGMLYGLGITAIVALTSIAIALVIASRESGLADAAEGSPLEQPEVRP